MVKLCKEWVLDTVEMRNAYAEALIEEAKVNSQIASVNCDLCSSCGMKPFEKAFPERAFNMGIQEANACGVAAGLSATGMVPFLHTFAVFATRRIYDQIFLSCAYAGQNVKVIGMDAGVSAATNGGTHMPFEDVGIMRVMPHITVIEPSDAVQVKSIVKQIANTHGVVYMRMPRKQVYRLYEEGSEFQVGKGAVIREGKDVTIMAYGMEVVEALNAAKALEAEGISARVVDMFTIKPIDKACVLESAEKTGAIVTAENANIIGGLGSAVAEILAENMPVPMERVGVQDEFGEVGDQGYLKDHFGLTAPYIIDKVKKVLARKK